MNSGERQKSSVELSEKNKWSKLEKLAQDGLDGNSMNEKGAKTETPEERQEKISQAAATVKEAYRENSTEQFTSVETGIVGEKPLSQDERSSSTTRKKLNKYDIIERPRIDRIKSNLNVSNISEYEMKQITSQPSAFTKTVRLIADRLGIRTKKSEGRREREAMHVALSEYHEEEAARKRAMEEKAKAEALERERRNAEHEAEKARREEEALARDMAMARDKFNFNKHDRFEKQRIQEIVERDLSSHLLTVDSLETEILSENPEVQKRLVSFEGVDIPIYDLKGLPFSLLSTTIDFKKFNNPDDLGAETFRKVLEDPSIWAERLDEAEKANGFGTINGNARGNTISASYWSSKRYEYTHVPGDLIYGFENVRADSIVRVFLGDGGTSNMAGNAETGLSRSQIDIVKQFESADMRNTHNEILLRRYSENGMPKKPDYIIVEDGNITKESFRHAKYFGIPIVNVIKSYYREKENKRGEELLASISEDDTYEEMAGKISELLSMPKYKMLYINHEHDQIGLFPVAKTPIDPNNPVEKRIIEISQIELFKRLDFIKSKLEEVTRSMESATKRGLPIEQNFPGFEYFDISIKDVQNQLKRTKGGNERVHYSSGYNQIDISFRLKGLYDIKTHVYDGEREYKATSSSSLLPKEYAKNSSFYDTLEPVVLKYFEAVRENEKLRKT